MTSAGAGDDAASSDTAAQACPDSPLPAPYCFQEHDVTHVIGTGPLDFAVGAGRFGPDDRVGFLVVRRIDDGRHELLHLLWDAEALALEKRLVSLPEELQGDTPHEGTYVIAQVEPGDFEGIVRTASEGKLARFSGGSRGLEYLSSNVGSWDAPGEPGAEVGIGPVYTGVDIDSDGVDEIMGLSQLWRWSSGTDHWEMLLNLPGDAMQPADAEHVCPMSDQIRATDIDGDTREDIVMIPASLSSCTGLSEVDRILTVVHNGTGTVDGFEATYLEIPFEDGERFLLTGDFDGDKNTDLVVHRKKRITEGRPAAVAVYMGSGDGSFEPALELLPAEIADLDPILAQVVDLDGDLVDELVISSSDYVHPTSRLLIVGSPRSSEEPFDLATPLRFSAFGDVDGDGRADVLARSAEGWSLLTSR